MGKQSSGAGNRAGYGSFMTATILGSPSPSGRACPCAVGQRRMGQSLLAVTTSTLSRTPTGFRSLALDERGDGDAEKTMDTVLVIETRGLVIEVK